MEFVNEDIIPTPQYLAQSSLLNLESAIRKLLLEYSNDGLTNIEISLLLGVFRGREEEIQICNLVLDILKAKGLIALNEVNDKWQIIKNKIS